MITKIDAILSLVPGAEVSVTGETVQWHKPAVASVTETQIATELARLQSVYTAQEYSRKRAKEYPPVTDYLDGVVKGNQTQIDAYIAACQAVKTKYPKPE